MAILHELSATESDSDDDFMEDANNKGKMVRSEEPREKDGKQQKKNETKPVKLSTFFVHAAKLFRGNFGPLNDLFRDLEERDIKLNEEQRKALVNSPFGSMLQVFMKNKMKKEELTKSNPGLERLVRTFCETKDGNYGFKLQEGVDAFVPTPEDMAVIFGLQMIENGIEDKLLNEHKALPTYNDLCKKYQFGSKNSSIKSTEVRSAIVTAISAGEVDDLVRLVVFYMCQTIFFSKTGNFGFKGIASHITGCCFYLLVRVDSETLTPRFARWDTFSISKAIAKLETLPFPAQSENSKISRGLTIPVDGNYEQNLISPTKQMSRLESSQQRVLKLEMENVCLIEEMEGTRNKVHEIYMKFRIERNRLRAKGKREKVDVTALISQLMLTTFDDIIKVLAGNLGNHEQVHLELPQRSDRHQEEEATQQHKPNGFFSLGLTQVFNDMETTNQQFVSRANNTEEIGEKKVSSLGRGVKTRSRNPKEIPEDFVTYGQGKKKQYKPFDTYKLVPHMKTDQEKALKFFFGHTTPSEFAWRMFDNTGVETIMVLGSHIQDLVDGNYLQGEILRYYMYRLDQKSKKAQSEMQDSQDDERYSRSAFMIPQAFLGNVDGIKTHVREFIRNIPDGVGELFIPIYSEKVTHWTLLHFNFFVHEWKHYNSLLNNTTRTVCNENAKKIMVACSFPIRQRNMALREKQPMIDPIEATPYSEAECDQQKKSDCLLFVCYYIKCIMKGQSLPRDRKDVLKKIKNKRIKMAVQLVSDRDHSNVSVSSH
ncbi:hypothetical protein MKW94_025545 [Papaver nudicaule]|uniref:Ubiquitin-like protease family profile domain-containing protein n=1 Tax=Papaver nudicaule TaxID=74823 RepID=A0AA41VFR5_PAPNU|nr:hypothetical protein [Papaver nudicaule]